MNDPESPTDKPRVPRIDLAESSPSSEELPPLPDGGLSSAMPTWLQQAPSRPTRSSVPETMDVSSLTAGVEVPEWLQELSRRVEDTVTPVATPPTAAERVEEEAVPTNEPELAMPDAALEAEALVDHAVTPKASGDSPLTVPDESVVGPQPARTFQVRSGDRSVDSASPSGSTQGAPLHRIGSEEGLVPSRGNRETGNTRTTHLQQPSAPEQSRSLAATVLLVLLLAALVAVGVWYYWG